MISLNRTILIGILLLLVAFATPASATVILASSSYSPDGPFVPGSSEHVVAQYAIIPSGSTTFAKNHELQMETGLLDAKWSIQVTQNGRNAAQQNAQGSVAFVNGEILSYTTNNDVGMIVTIDGMVPQDAASPFMVLSVEEIDNSGNVVPGSVITLTQPIAGQTSAVSPSAVPTLTPQMVPTQTPAAKSPGLTGSCALCACVLVLALLVRRSQ